MKCTVYVATLFLHLIIPTTSLIGFELCYNKLPSRLMVVSREAKKKQAIRDERVNYLHVALL